MQRNQESFFLYLINFRTRKDPQFKDMVDLKYFALDLFYFSLPTDR
jgi:hypothetical protein